MRSVIAAIVLASFTICLPAARSADAPTWLPKYDVAINLDVAGHMVRVSQNVTWINRHQRAAKDVVFNVHSAYAPPTTGIDYLFLSKMLEIMRIPPGEAIYAGTPIEIRSVALIRRNGKNVERTDLKFAFSKDNPTALNVELLDEVKKDESISLAIDFDLKLPQKQGRWGQWKGVTCLSNWLPVLAYYDEKGWQPTPFVAWHQPFFNEAGVYNVHLRLHKDQKVAASGAVRKREVDGDNQDLWYGPITTREFTLAASDRFEEHVVEVGKTKVKCLAFPEHAFYGKVIPRIAARAVETYTKWFGPYPNDELVFVETFFGWNGNECSGLVMIDQRVFNMPELAEGYVEYLVSHETCHQWFYNVIGTDGYRETFMDEAFANYFAHRLVNTINGKNNSLFKYPKKLEWLPNVEREDYRFSQFYGTIGRNELGPALQDMPKYRHVVNLFSAAYDRGSKIVGMRNGVPIKAEAGARVVVYLKQQGEYNEPTTLGFSFDNDQLYPLRIPIDLRTGSITIDQPPTNIELLADQRVRVEVILPKSPTQITVDPDQILPDRQPANNFWKTPVRFRVTPLYTALDDNDLTASYDRWNVTVGPWMYGAPYSDPWFTRASVIGARAGAFRTQQYSGGVYLGYRPDFRDLAAGIDSRWLNPIIPKTELGFHAEKSLTEIDGNQGNFDRAVFYSRYVFDQSASLYTAPMHYVEAFASWQQNYLSTPRDPVPGAVRFEKQSNLGLHYHVDYLTPYWDPEMGAKLDITYAAGLPILGEKESSQQVMGQVSWVHFLPAGHGYLSRTKLAYRLYGGIATPAKALLYSLGGNLLFRGFDIQERQGSALWIGSIEWRLPLFHDEEYDVLDHVVGFRRLHLAPFYDVGDIYANQRSVGQVAHAVGIGIRAEVAWFSFIERTTLRLDFAKTVNASSPVQFWLGVQHPF
ncbi:MAG: BamA/TamA family outer membrane protein [Planctomycetes bacterium]|nr:BamA/TamA family outer membrane protein [Planctomycetota bacterium]